MSYPKFGPAAQTPEQRAQIVEKMQQTIPLLRKKAKLSAHVRQFYAQYVAGDLSWEQVSNAIHSMYNY